MRVRYQKQELSAFIEGLLLPVKDGISRRRLHHPHTLCSMNHTEIPEWKIKLKGSHPRETIFDWIIAKKLLKLRTSRGEDILVFLLSKFEWEYDILKILSNPKFIQIPIQLERMIQKLLEPHLFDAKRMLHSFDPSVMYHKEWKPLFLPPVQYIGVGYKDHGTLGSAPSWKDQILPGKEMAVQPNRFSFRYLLSMEVFLNSEVLELPSTDESQLGRKRG